MIIHKLPKLKRLDTKRNEPTSQNSIKVPKVVNSTNKKTLLLALETSVIYSPFLSHPKHYSFPIPRSLHYDKN